MTEPDQPMTDEEARAMAAREAEVEALIYRAQDPEDAYDGHHGNDRSEDSLEYARIHNPALAKRIEDNILTNAME